MYALQARGVPAGACQTMRDKMEADPQLRERGFYVEAEHPELGQHRFEGLPLRFSRARWEVCRPSPCLGEHTRDVLTGILGYSHAEFEELVAEAAV
jgi:crotonobetainyl-CoA:carnitine CoA-transferase CaiB-like acyl-CoA transferase